MQWYATKKEAMKHMHEDQKWLKDRNEDPSYMSIEFIEFKPTRKEIAHILNSFAGG